jgi:hypothetical protein
MNKYSTQEAQQLSKNDGHNNDHGEEENNDTQKKKRATRLKAKMIKTTLP